jgi:antitoxin PrlF
MNYTHTLTSKGQITIPKDIRERLQIKPGDRASFRVTKDGRVVVERLKTFEEIHIMLGRPTFKDPLSEREKLAGPYLRDKYVKNAD